MERLQQRVGEPTRVVLYARHARDDHGTVLTRELDLLEKFAAEQDLTVIGRYADVRPSFASLPAGLEAALTRLKLGDVLLVVDPTRLSRNTATLYTVAHCVQAAGATIRTMHGGLEGPLPPPDAVQQFSDSPASTAGRRDAARWPSDVE